MKLLKLSEEHYILADKCKLDIKVGDWITDKYFVYQWKDDSSLLGRLKVTHSTEPIEFGWGQEGRDIVSKKIYNKVNRLSLLEVKKLLGIVDIDKKAVNFSKRYSNHDDSQEAVYDGYNEGYKQCLIDNKEKKYTEEDIRKAMGFGFDMCHQKRLDEYGFESFIKSLHPKTEWEIEFVDGKLKLIQ